MSANKLIHSIDDILGRSTVSNDDDVSDRTSCPEGGEDDIPEEEALPCHGGHHTPAQTSISNPDDDLGRKSPLNATMESNRTSTTDINSRIGVGLEADHPSRSLATDLSIQSDLKPPFLLESDPYALFGQKEMISLWSSFKSNDISDVRYKSDRSDDIRNGRFSSQRPEDIRDGRYNSDRDVRYNNRNSKTESASDISEYCYEIPEAIDAGTHFELFPLSMIGTSQNFQEMAPGGYSIFKNLSMNPANFWTSKHHPAIDRFHLEPTGEIQCSFLARMLSFLNLLYILRITFIFQDRTFAYIHMCVFVYLHMCVFVHVYICACDR